MDNPVNSKYNRHHHEQQLWIKLLPPTKPLLLLPSIVLPSRRANAFESPTSYPIRSWSYRTTPDTTTDALARTGLTLL